MTDIKKENVVIKKQQPGASTTKLSKTKDVAPLMKKINERPNLGLIGGMFLYTSSFQLEQEGERRETFRGCPTTSHNPFVEIFWDPFAKHMVLVGKDTRETFKVFPKLTTAGHYLINKDKATGSKVPYQQERLMVTEFNEHYLSNIDEIDQLVSSLAVNKDFDWRKFLTV